MSRTFLRHGFTLIELSIVLVIIGLIVGGILAGNELVRAAKLRSLIKEVNQLTTAVNTFKGKYNCLPGDCARATQFFGTAGDCTVQLDDTATCSGDGNGLILSDSFYNHGGEHLYMAHHMKLAWLTDLPLTQPNDKSVLDAGLFLNLPGRNVLGSNAEKTIGYTVVPVLDSMIATSGSPVICSFPGSPPVLGNQITMGGQGIYYPYMHSRTNIAQPAMSGMDAYSIDAKMDDGHPARGKIIVPIYAYWAGMTNQPACNSSFGDNLSYNRTDDKARGGLMFLTSF